MALKSIRSILTISFIAILCLTLIPTGHVRALASQFNGVDLPALGTFVEHVKNGQADELRGVYIPDLLADRVVQQPAGMYGFVSSWQNVLTQFGLASKFGSTGLLAHNNLAGKRFAALQNGQKFHLIYGDGQISTFVIAEILQFQALEPTSTSSSFVDLQSGDILTSSELFTKIYDRPGQVILQTCIDADHNASWGRLFIIAKPYTE